MGLLAPQKPFFLDIALLDASKDADVLSISDQLKKFEYTLMAGEKGATSLTYKIEIINPLESVEKVFRNFLSRYYPDLKKKDPGNALIMPKVLIQWGYGREKEDGLSKIHLAQVSDVKYNFSSGKEKTLILTAIGDISMFDSYSRGILSARHEIRFEGRLGWRGPRTKPPKVDFAEVITTLIGTMGANLPLTDVNIESFPSKFVGDALQGFLEAHTSKNYGKYQSIKDKDAFYIEGIEKIFQYLGINVEVTDARKKGDMYKIVFSKLGDTSGETEVKLIHPDQLKSGALADYNKLNKARRELYDTAPMNVPVQRGQFIPSYNLPDGLTLVDIDNAEDLKIVNTYSNLKGQQGNFSNSASIRVSTGGYEFDATLTGGWNLVEDTDIGRALNAYDKNAVEQDKDLQEMLRKATGMEEGWVAAMPVKAKLSDLSEEQKKDLEHSRGLLVFTWDSPETEELAVTIQNFLSKLNTLFPEPGQHIHMYSQSPTLYAERGSKSLAETYKEFVDNPLNHMTTLSFSQDKVAREADNKGKDMEIFSFPQMSYDKEDLRLSKLTYGGNDSTVRFFDFTSDLGYLLASMQGIRSYLEVTNNAYLLTHDRLESAIFYFLGEIVKSKDAITDEEKKDRITEDFESQHGRGVGLELSEETLNFLADLEAEIGSKALRDLYQRGNPRADDVATFKAFLVMLQEKAALSAFFNMKGGKHRSSYNLIFPSSSKNEKVDNTIAYTLVKGNLFDQFSEAGDGLGQQRALEQWATNYLQGYPSQVRLKTLGVPEMDTLQEVNRSRAILFDVHDLSKERITGKREIHWLSGVYIPIALKHTASPSEGYLTELKLLRDAASTTPRET